MTDLRACPVCELEWRGPWTDCPGCLSMAGMKAVSDLHAALASQGAGSPQGDLQRAIQFGQMRGAWMFDHAWTAWEEQEARIARAQPVKTATDTTTKGK